MLCYHSDDYDIIPEIIIKAISISGPLILSFMVNVMSLKKRQKMMMKSIIGKVKKNIFR